MITVITGVPGSGKTLYAMQMIEEQCKAGREVYSDIDDCEFPGVQPAPDDWRTLPEGAFCVYDEAHQKFPATGKAGLSDDPRVKDLDTHRHGGYDLVYITQASTRLHHDIRKLAGRHIHVQRNFGANTVTLYMWERAANENDKNDRSMADQQLWHYPKKLYRYYKSATIHTHKRRIPKKLLMIGLAAISFFGVGIYMASQNSFLSQAADSISGSEQVASAQPMRPVTVSASSLPPIIGCISSDRNCLCYEASGKALDMTLAQCRLTMLRPLPRAISTGAKSASPPPAQSIDLKPLVSGGDA